MCSETRKLAEKLSTLETDDAFRNECTGQLLEKLYSMGVINTKRLKHCKEVSVSSFCRRRLPVFMKKSGMFNGPLEVAGKAFIDTLMVTVDLTKSCNSTVKYVKHGHVRVGPHVVYDPAFLVTRDQEDFIAWTDKFRENIDTYNEKRDDYKD